MNIILSVLLSILLGSIIGVVAVCLLFISGRSMIFKIFTGITGGVLVLISCKGYIQMLEGVLFSLSYLSGVFVMAILNSSPKMTEQ